MMQNSATAKITVAKFWNRRIYCIKILRARNSSKSRSSHCCGNLQQQNSTKWVSLPLLRNSVAWNFTKRGTLSLLQNFISMKFYDTSNITLSRNNLWKRTFLNVRKKSSCRPLSRGGGAKGLSGRATKKRTFLRLLPPILKYCLLCSYTDFES